MWVDQNRRPSDYKTMTHPVCKNPKTATKKRLLNQKSAKNLRLSHKSQQLNSRLSQQNEIFEQHSNSELRVRLVRLFESKNSLQELTPMVPEGALVLAISQFVLFSGPTPTGWSRPPACSAGPTCCAAPT